MKRLLIVVAAAFMCMSAQAQLNPMEPIPADKAVRIGKLENGMTYYIRHNQKPKGQASFYILHDVGAIQESDNQQGLAHFLEHMAFNGTKNLPGKQMINYLETIGVKFGTNLNAATSWDQTSYMITDVPVTRQGVIDTAMLILHDWSHFISLVPKEIDNERGVISEELRTRDGAEWRSALKLIAALGKDTKYEHRNLIGYLDGLKSFSYDDIRSFYETWYRPDYQAVVIVGDVDVDKVEADLIKLMADIPAPAADAPTKELIMIPENTEPIISIYTNPEMTKSDANIFIKRPAMQREVNGLILRPMMDAMLAYSTTLLNARLSEIAQQPNAPFLSASTYEGNIGLIPTMDASNFTVTTEDGKLSTGFEALLTEVEKARRFGFTQSEFERAQENLMRYAERHYNNRNDRDNDSYSDALFANFQKGMSIPDAEYEWKLDSTLIKMITVEDINGVYQQIIQPANWVITVNAPEKEGIVNPTAEDLTTIIAKVRAAELTAHQDNTIKEPLIADLKALKGSAVKHTATNEAFGITEWTLKNGVKIIVKPTTFKTDEVNLAVSSNGGASLLTDEEFYTAALMSGILSSSGVGKFSATDLRKQLAGKSASVNAFVGGYAHGMNGYGSPKDVETMLQLLYLNFTQPRFNEDDFNTFMNQVRAQVENLQKNPDYIAYENYQKTLYGNNYRGQLISPEIVNGIQFGELKTIYDKLFNGANNFTFTFVGNTDLATLKPLVEKYIGSIPTSKTKLNYKDDGLHPVKGDVVNDFKAQMQQPKVSVWFAYTGDVPYTIENRMLMTYLSQALTSRYLVSIREEKGGTYGVQVQGSSEYEPKENYTLLIQFDTNEQMADELCQIIKDEVNKIAAEGPLSEDMDKTREYLAKSWKNGLEENGSWMQMIQNYYRYNMDYMADYEKTLQSITKEDVQKFTQKILADGNLVNVIMRPDTAAE